MSVAFCDLARDPAELARMLVELKLAKPAEHPEISLLSGGVSSSIFRVRLQAGDYCVKQALPKLKVQKDWYAPVERVFAEAAWLQTAGVIVPRQVPKVLAIDHTRGAFVMEYLAPASYCNWKSELLAARVDPEVGRQLGELLGLIHAATARDANLAGRFAHDANFFALRLEPYLIESARMHPDLAPRLLALVKSTQQHQLALVHGDVSPKNILLGPVGPVLLDAECACYGDPAFDLAFLLNHLLLKAVHRPGAAAGYLASFTAIAAAHLAHVAWEPRPLFEQRAAALLPGLMLARIDGKSPVEYLDTPARDRVRRCARRLLLTPPLELQAFPTAIRESLIR